MIKNSQIYDAAISLMSKAAIEIPGDYLKCLKKSFSRRRW